MTIPFGLKKPRSLAALISVAFGLGAPLAALAQTNATSMPAVAAPASGPVNAAAALSVIEFWREAGPRLWFAKDPEFDRRFRDSFLRLHEMAAKGELSSWQNTADGALALVLLLDQFPRNAFRGTPRMYATDIQAKSAADAAIAAGHDRSAPADLQLFFYLPFAHSENEVDQERSVALCQRLGEPHLSHAIGHRDIVRRFGRFPHRNPILGRQMTEQEQRFLNNGGFKG